jgi:hypothetical protein
MQCLVLGNATNDAAPKRVVQAFPSQYIEIKKQIAFAICSFICVILFIRLPQDIQGFETNLDLHQVAA